MKCSKFLAGMFGAVLMMAMVEAPVHAAPAANTATAAAQTIRSLQQAHLMARKVGTSYYKYSLENRKPEERRKFLELIRQVDILLLRQAANSAVQQGWQAVKAAAATDPYAEGDVDQLRLYAMEDAQIALDQAVAQEITRIKTAERLPPGGKADMLMELAALMEKIAGTYIRNAADPMGGANYSGRGANTDPAAMAKQFSDLLARTRAAYADNGEASAELNDVFQKWNFIRARLIDFNQKTVPYIVSTYNEQITRKLSSLYDKQGG